MTTLVAKRCRHCDTLKVAAEFPRNRRVSDGRSSWCRVCSTASTRDWMKRHPDAMRRLQQQQNAKARAETAPRREARIAAAIGKSCRVPWRTCRYCGEVFLKPRTARTVQFCSYTCRRRGHRRTMTSRAEREFRVVVFDRDGWQCQLCRKPVERISGKSQMGPTIDHIIPVSRGGPHTLENVQLAHRACNARKGVGAGQLRLTL